MRSSRRPTRRPRVAGFLPRAALVAVVCLLGPSLAAAATLQLAGPAGTRVSVDGAPVGVLPLAAPLTLAVGPHEITGELAGLQPHRLQVSFENDDEWRHVTLHPLPYQRRIAVLSNVVLAGTGQRYLGHPKRGLLYSAVEVGGLVTALLSEVSRANAHDEYLRALDVYHQAVNQDEVIAARVAVDAKLQDTRDAADRRDLGLLAAAGAVVVSMADAWLSFGHVTAGGGELPPATAALAVPSSAPGFHTAVRLDF